MRAILDCDRSGCGTLTPLQEFDSAMRRAVMEPSSPRPAAIGQTFSTELSRNDCPARKDFPRCNRLQRFSTASPSISHHRCAAIASWSIPGQADIKMEQWEIGQRLNAGLFLLGREGGNDVDATWALP